MPVYDGIDGFIQYVIGTGAYVAFGNAVGSVGDNDQELQHERGAGGTDDVVFGVAKPKASVDSVYKGADLLTNSARTVYNGLPPVIHVQGGIKGVTNGAHAHTGYVDSVEVTCEGPGKVVRVKYDILALTDSLSTVTAPATCADTAAFVGVSGGVTIDGAAYKTQGYSTKLLNNLKHGNSLDDAAGSNVRWPENADWGSEQVQVRCTVALPYTLDLMANTPTLPVIASFKISNGYTTKTITNRRLFMKANPTKIAKTGDTQLWDIELESQFDCLQSAGTAAWSIA